MPSDTHRSHDATVDRRPTTAPEPLASCVVTYHQWILSPALNANESVTVHTPTPAEPITTTLRRLPPWLVAPTNPRASADLAADNTPRACWTGEPPQNGYSHMRNLSSASTSFTVIGGAREHPPQPRRRNAPHCADGTHLDTKRCGLNHPGPEFGEPIVVNSARCCPPGSPGRTRSRGLAAARGR